MPSAVSTSAEKPSPLRIFLSLALKRAKPALVSVRTKRPILKVVLAVVVLTGFVERNSALRFRNFWKVSCDQAKNSRSHAKDAWRTNHGPSLLTLTTSERESCTNESAFTKLDVPFQRRFRFHFDEIRCGGDSRMIQSSDFRSRPRVRKKKLEKIQPKICNKMKIFRLIELPSCLKCKGIESEPQIEMRRLWFRLGQPKLRLREPV